MILLVLAGCVINGDKYPRPRDLAPNWLVDRTRILAIRAEPPEAEPGAAISFEALIVDAEGVEPELAVVWLACPVDDEGNGFGCATDLGSLDLEDPDPEALAELGLIGLEPFLTPAYTVPDDLLDGLDDRERLEGVYVLIQLLALPLESVEDPVAEVDFAEVESAYKRLVVSEATTPNHNPQIASFTVDAVPVPAGAPVYVEPEQTYALGITLPDGAIETYQYLLSDGSPEERLEEPYASWYATGGEVLEEVTLWPYIEADWTAPPERGAEGTWYAVLRDRRGGMAWATQRWVADVPPSR
jgi:hypothetical protein